MISSKMIGSKIAAARKRTNISQAQLAERLFISPQAVGKWERGESMPDIITLNRLSEILGVDLNYFSDNNESAGRGPVTADTADELPVDNVPGGQGNRTGWDMSQGNWVDADFSGLKNLQEKFSSSNMQRCKFTGSGLSGLLLKGNNVDTCDFTASDFTGSHIRRSNILNSVFKDCSLRDAEISWSYLNDCDFTGADLTGAVISNGGIEKCCMEDAGLNRTSFIALHLTDMVFEGTIEDCLFDNCWFVKVTFRNSTLINTFFKANRKLKRVRFTDCKADRLTYEVLRQGGADMNGITLLEREGGNE
jgi:transcriptional regulator with XRE-family HTH domain